MKCCICIFFLFSVTFIPGTESIVNGVPGKPGQFPYVAGLFIKRYHLLNCGGAIVTNRLIITTAHCICNKWSYKYLYVKVGSHDYNFTGVRYDVMESICHENFEPKNIQNDIGLLKTVLPIQYTRDIKPISLLRREIPAGEFVIVAGWGCVIRNSTNNSDFPSDIRYSFLQVLPKPFCEIYFSKFRDKYFCTETDLRTGLCKGDSGNPVTFKGQLAGIAFAHGDKRSDLFLKISDFRKWIKEKIKKHHKIVGKSKNGLYNKINGYTYLYNHYLYA